MEKKYDVFISYARKDSEIADKLCESLDAVGISYFIDRSEIGLGDEYINRLNSSINDSQIIIYLASRNSYDSFWTNKELTYAIKKKSNKDIMPYIIDDNEMPDDKAFLLSDINIWKMSEHDINDIVETIKSRLPNQYKNDIYICGSRRDANEVEVIYEYLTQQGYSCFCWRDLSYDKDISSQTRKAIINCSLFVFYQGMWGTYGSKWALRELEFAENNNKHIVFLRSGQNDSSEYYWNLNMYDKAYIIDWLSNKTREYLIEKLHEKCYELIGPGINKEKTIK